MSLIEKEAPEGPDLEGGDKTSISNSRDRKIQQHTK
jgi:hypothetical protein